MGGKAPGASLPLWPYKSKLLMFKSKASHHLLSEGKHSLQGDKHKKHFPCHHQGRDVHTIHAQGRNSKEYWNSVCCVLYL